MWSPTIYHPEVIAQRIHLAEQTFGFRLHAYSRDESLYVAAEIEKKYDLKKKQYSGLTPNEQLFIRNEILMSRCDYRYATRYFRILLDDETGEEGPLSLWSAQERLIQRVGEVELKMWQYVQSGRKRLDGNCWYVHKRRQTGASTVVQSMGVHRTVLWSNMNGLAASTNEDKINELYTNYYYFMLERLPRWMQPSRQYDNETGVAFANASKVVLQNAMQDSGLGQGAKWHWAHLTECASWPQTKIVDQIENHFTNAISASIKGMAFLESTSQGIDDWWHRTTELARRHEMNRWNYFFVPWYAIEEISIDYPPEGWQPKAETLRHAESVERTSPEFMDGATVRLTSQQMYFWESKRHNAEVSGSLAEFYKNYPSTPEESFVSSGRSSFPIEVIRWHDENTREPYAYYDILTNDTPSELVITEPVRRADGTLSHPPRIQQFGPVKIGPVWVSDEEHKHPLGLIRIWENPDDVRKFDTYASCDTADGIANWTRFIRKREDEIPDRAAIQMFRQAATRDRGVLDVQIGEFFAPISPIATAPYVVALAMLMHGRNALDQQPPLMIELTGGGKTLQEELINRYGWMHFYQDFKFNGQDWEETDKFGWTSTAMSVRQLWAKGKQRLVDKRVILRSKPLVNEMRICQDEAIYLSLMTRFSRGKAKEGSGQHDDLVYATMFDLWQANMFNLTPSGTTTAPVHMTAGAAPNGQLKLRDMMPDERALAMQEIDERIMGGYTGW